MSKSPAFGDDTGDDGRTPAAVTHSTSQGVRASMSRSNSQWSEHHNVGTSYFPPSPVRRATSPPASRRNPSGMSTQKHQIRSSSARRKAVRSTSLASSHARRGKDTGVLSEEEEDDSNDPAETPKSSAAEDDEDETGTYTRHPRSIQDEEDPVTLKERQSLINDEHPFGLPIWKPALYKKSRTVTRNAETALHNIPSAAVERILLPGNIFWTLFFGWWLSAVCIIVSGLLYFIPGGGRQFSTLAYGLGWYIFWPFGKYVEGDKDIIKSADGDDDDDEDEQNGDADRARHSVDGSQHSGGTVRGVSPDAGHRSEPSNGTISQATVRQRAPDPFHTASASWNVDERTALLTGQDSRPAPILPSKAYGATLRPSHTYGVKPAEPDTGSYRWLGQACFWLLLITIIAPLLLIVCTICWALVVTVPMAKLNWELIKHLFTHPSKIRFCSAPKTEVRSPPNTEDLNEDLPTTRTVLLKSARLHAGQDAPSGKRDSTVLLCTYRAVGWQYYKYTVGGVNIMFVNLMPIVFFVIFDGMVLLPLVERREHHHQHVSPLLAFLASRSLIFLMSLASVIPLSYFIGMAVASISAQSSIGMGAVINATFGSIIEIILYAIALTDGKGKLVEGSIVGSLLAGVLLMPGMSMVSMAFKRKEQRFNARSANVTSTMLIMAIFGILTPTLFYQTYGNFELICDGCPPALPGSTKDAPWVCKRCYYSLPDPVTDPFYQERVKSLMYFCSGILVFSYLIGLWFSLRTHASSIWQNPQQVMQPENPSRLSLYHKLLNIPGAQVAVRKGGSAVASLRRKPSVATTTGSFAGGPSMTDIAGHSAQPSHHPTHITLPPPSPIARKNTDGHVGYTPIIEHVAKTVGTAGIEPAQLQLPPSITTDDFTRAVAVATVSALRHQDVSKLRGSAAEGGHGHGGGGHGGHDAPSWSRTVSASVLLGCTFLYALIAEILVDVVDVVLEGSGIDEKFLGITLFALVPNTTEFMNAMSFAINGNISLSMEIGSAYALQVCLLQIPAMVAFSAWYDPRHMGTVADTFTLIFPRWDVIAIILSIFLLTYTYIEAKSNYHRGSILILSYLVMAAGFYFAPQEKDEDITLTGLNALSTSLKTSWSQVPSAPNMWCAIKAFALSVLTR